MPFVSALNSGHAHSRNSRGEIVEKIHSRPRPLPMSKTLALSTGYRCPVEACWALGERRQGGNRISSFLRH
jgi:hypothetical protein